MKSVAVFVGLSIVVGAYLLISSAGIPAPEEYAEPTGATSGDRGSSAPAMRRTTPPTITSAVTERTLDATTASERELAERLWTAFNSDLADQAEPVEHERIEQLIRDNPELAQELAQKAQP
jgi:hypothetical protein